MITGMMRIKNEARWIRSVLQSALAVCERVYILDDHSTDNTPEICQSFGEKVRLYSSPFEGLDESRDKNYLLDVIRLYGAEWILAIDGDELLLDPKEIKTLLAPATFNAYNCYSLRVLYLWNNLDQVRTDGVYGHFWRPSLFRAVPGVCYSETPNGGNFHCGNVPQGLIGSAPHCDARLLHFGYMDARDRRRKYDWYNQHDPENHVEDCYRHMIQGDPGGPSADLHLRHAGPLVLAPLEIRESAAV